MPIWDQLSNDPMSLMMIYQGMNDFARNISRQSQGPSNLPPGWGGGGGQQDSTASMLPLMLKMRAMNADQQFEQQKFDFAKQQALAQQQAAERDRQLQMEQIQSAAKAMGVDPSIVGLDPKAAAGAYSDRLKAHELAPGGRLYFGDQMAAENPALLQNVGDIGWGDPRSGKTTIDPKLLAAKLNANSAGATRVSVAPQITMGTASKLGDGVQEVMTDFYKRAEAANNSANAADTILEFAKNNPDAVGPGMGSLADVYSKGQALANMAGAGDVLTDDQKRLIDVQKSIADVQHGAAMDSVQRLTGSKTEEEFAREERNFPDVSSLASTIELRALKEKTARDWFNNALDNINGTINAKIKSGEEVTMLDVDQVKRDFIKAHPITEDYRKNLGAYFQSRRAVGGQPVTTAPAPPPVSTPTGVSQRAAKYFQ